MSPLRRIALAVSVAALGVAAAAVPAVTNLQPDPPAQTPAQDGVALRPTAIEYGLIAALPHQQPGTDPAVAPGFGGGSIGPGAYRSTP